VSGCCGGCGGPQRGANPNMRQRERSPDRCVIGRGGRMRWWCAVMRVIPGWWRAHHHLRRPASSCLGHSFRQQCRHPSPPRVPSMARVPRSVRPPASAPSLALRPPTRCAPRRMRSLFRLMAMERMHSNERPGDGGRTAFNPHIRGEAGPLEDTILYRTYPRVIVPGCPRRCKRRRECDVESSGGSPRTRVQ
jgi:hypothetical protein